MSEQSTLRQKAREAIQAGKLPSLRPERTWGGPGSGACCPICDEPVKQDEVEFEIEFAREDEGRVNGAYHVHLRCFRAWEFERHNSELAGA